MLVAGSAWASYARDAIRSLRWGFLCLLRLSQVALRLLMPVTLLDVALGLLMPVMLFAGCAWAYYLPVMLFAGCAWASYACARDAIRGCAWASYVCDASRRLRLGFLCLWCFSQVAPERVVALLLRAG